MVTSPSSEEIITCLNRIQVILKVFENACSLKINCSKVKPYELEHMKIELINPGQMEWSQFLIKVLAVNFANSILNNSNWDTTSEGITKKFISGTE